MSFWISPECPETIRDLIVNHGGKVYKTELALSITHYVIDAKESAREFRRGIPVVTDAWVTAIVDGKTPPAKSIVSKADDDDEDSSEEEVVNKTAVLANSKRGRPAAKKDAESDDTSEEDVKPTKAKTNSPFKTMSFWISPKCPEATRDLILKHGGKVLKTESALSITHYVIDAKESARFRRGATVVTDAWVTAIAAGKTPPSQSIVRTPEDDDESEDSSEESSEEEVVKNPVANPKRGRPVAQKDAESDGTSEEDVKPTKKAVKPAAAKAIVVKPEPPKSIVANMLSSKSYPTDYRVPNSNDWVVHMDSAGNVYDFMLNQTNIAQNNNKFYLVQVLRHVRDQANFGVLNVWGRVNEHGQTSWSSNLGMSGAIVQADKKIKDKSTHNISTLFANPNITTKPGKYTYLKRQIPADSDDEADVAGVNSEGQDVVSKLHPRVKALMELITDTTMINSQLMEIGVDTKKMPLGSLSPDIISRGMTTLAELEEEIKKKSPSRSEILRLSNNYYTLVPHDFGRKQPIPINTTELLQKEVELIKALSDVEGGQKVLKLKQTEKEKLEEHPIDSKYNMLETDIRHIPADSELYKNLSTFMTNTVGGTHHWFDAQITDIFAIDKKMENVRQETFYAKDENKGDDWNRQLLWHGSRISNWCGILTSSLRLPADLSPSIPRAGAMFDSGCYGANASSKSFNYCSAAADGSGCIALLEVVCGGHEHHFHADYYASLHMRPGHKSVKALGKTRPDEAGSMYMKFGDSIDDAPTFYTPAEAEDLGYVDCVKTDSANDTHKAMAAVEYNAAKQGVVKLPMGKLTSTVDPPCLGYLQYDEIIVFNPAQLRIKYLIRYNSKNLSSRF